MSRAEHLDPYCARLVEPLSLDRPTCAGRRMDESDRNRTVLARVDEVLGQRADDSLRPASTPLPRCARAVDDARGGVDDGGPGTGLGIEALRFGRESHIKVHPL
jgi:hypothetical protein